MTKRERDLQRIWALIEITGPPEWPSPCWRWKGATGGRDARPVIEIDGRKQYVARLMLLLVKGPPAEVVEMLKVSHHHDHEDNYERAMRRFVARHKCDNKGCPNPGHLEWGTHRENMKDMKERERHGLPHYVVRNIRKLLAKGRTQEEISDLYGVSRETISAVATRRVYDHVKDAPCAPSNEKSTTEGTK